MRSLFALLLVAGRLGGQPAPAAPCAPTDRGPTLGTAPAHHPTATFDSVWALIARTHWDSSGIQPRWDAARARLRPQAEAARTRGELRAVIGALLDTLGQSHFRLIPEEEADGIGTVAIPDRSGWLGLEFRLVDGVVAVTAVDSGGPAWRGGLRAGWRLEAIGPCPVAPIVRQLTRMHAPRHLAVALQQALMTRLAGPPGAPVEVTAHDGRRATVHRLVRDTARGITTKFGNLPSLAVELTWRRLRRGDRTLGVIRFSLWMPAIAPAFDAALDSLRGSDGFILDLRGNLGGVGGMVTGIAGHFFDSTATIGTMRQRGATFRFQANPRRGTADGRSVSPYAGPLVLLVDELSASTSEIFAAGLQALGRARVVGVPTPGEALPAVPERLPNGDVLYHAIADFVSPRGAPIEGRGVIPDEVVPLSFRALQTLGDPPLEAALGWLASRPKSRAAAPSPVSGR